MTVLRTVLPAVLVAAGLVLAAPVPVFACDCAVGDVRDHLAAADVVVLGQVTGITPPLGSDSRGSDPRVTYTLDVVRVMEGRSTKTLDVVSHPLGASCGVEDIQRGREYVFFASHDASSGGPAELRAQLCGGTGLASDSLVAEVESLAGAGDEPDPDPATTTDAEAGDVDDEQPPGPTAVTPWAWAGGVAAILGIGGLLLARRRRPTA